MLADTGLGALANFRRVAGERPIKLHSIVARLVDPKVLDRLRGDG